MNEESIFCGALECPSTDAQAAYLDQACGGDHELRGRVETLLRLRNGHASFLAEPAAIEGRPTRSMPFSGVDGSGSVIGPYKLLERIGEGGFGAVYMAEQREPVQRRVALKVIKAGMDTRQVIARFEAERQALAMMDHPHIARVLDAGATEAHSPLGPGRPYFVMELVKGVPITRFCDEQRLGLDERLELFSDACHAVQHAHQKGIIHRDLKPSNVLVSRFDDEPVVKIIDFGLAKATGGRLTDKTLFTEFRQMIGTPAYMSPEQAGLSDLDVDTRSDIYSLGVLLYELLTGTTPFAAERLRSADFDELRRIIREEEPPKPSTRVSTLRSEPHAAERPSSALDITRCRRTDPRSLMRSLHGDLDWIVMKSLEKDRTRRYETASGLAQDVERYLKNEPVLAGPPSRSYRLRKFVRRNRAMVTATAAVGGVLLCGVAGTTFGLLRAEKRWAEAETARAQTQQVSDFQATMLSEIDVRAMGNGIKTHFREQVQAVLEREYVGEYPDGRQRTPEEIEAGLAAFDRLADAAEAMDVARGVMDEFVLARAVKALEERFADQPLVRAQLLMAIAMTYAELGLYGPAERHARTALDIRRKELGAEHELVSFSLHSVADALLQSGDYDGAEPLYWEALAIASNRLGDGHSSVAQLWMELGKVRHIRDGPDAAEPLFRKALELSRAAFGEESTVVADVLAMLAVCLGQTGKDAEAERLFKDSLAMHRELGDGPETAVCLSGFADFLERRGDHAAAEERYTEALGIWSKSYGHDSRAVINGLIDLGRLLENRGDHAGAAQRVRDSLELQQKLLEADDPLIARTLHNLGVSLEGTGDYAAAEQKQLEALDIYRQYSRPTMAISLNKADSLKRLGALLCRRGEHAKAAARFRESLEIRRETQSGCDPGLAFVLHHYADALRAMHELDEAEEVARESVEIYRASPSPVPGREHEHAVEILTQTLVDFGRREDAILVQRELVDDCRRLLPPEDRILAAALSRLGRLLVEQGRNAEAEPVLRECVAIREEATGPDSPPYWYLAHARSLLGEALVGQGVELLASDASAAISRFSVAEPLLSDSAAGLILNAESIPEQARSQRVRQALERIVRLYEAWDIIAPDSGKAEQAAAWRAELERLPGR